MKIKNNRAISTIEYSLIVVVVIGALLAMQIYFKRALCGRWRQTADTFGFGRQYGSPSQGFQIWGK